MMRQVELPDGLNVFSLNPDEARSLHREVFVSRCYLRNGIQIHDGDCIFDVGANIGIATLSFHRQGKGIRIFAFEPGPAAFACLKANVELHSIDARIFECGLAQASGTADFTFYPGNTIQSGFHTDLEQDRGNTRNYLLNSGFSTEKADLLVRLLFKEQVFRCQLRALSEIVEQEKVDRIDLLKIDVERSERDVLAGIRQQHWPLIRQIVIEVQDDDGTLESVKTLLRNQNFEVVVEQDPLLKNTRLFNVFAIRRS
jgi:31-O-methyltransferase